jgi:hypothetical protein
VSENSKQPSHEFLTLMLPRRTIARIAKPLSKGAAEAWSQLAAYSAVFDTERSLGEQLAAAVCPTSAS